MLINSALCSRFMVTKGPGFVAGAVATDGTRDIPMNVNESVQDFRKRVVLFFRHLCNNVANACKTIVHSHDARFYESAKKEFDKLSGDKHIVEEHSRHYKNEKLAHYFIRVFRHSHDMRELVLHYYSAWHRCQDKKTHPQAFDSELQLQLQIFLKKEIEMYEVQKRLACEKVILEHLSTNEKIREGLHKFLLGLEESVVLLCWCSEWKNEYLFFFDHCGPITNLLRVKSVSNMQTTPTFQLGDKKIHITDIFSQSTINTLEHLEPQDWIKLIKDGYMLEHMRQHHTESWVQLHNSLDVKKLKKDMHLYKFFWKKSMKKWALDHGDNDWVHCQDRDLKKKNTWRAKFSGLEIKIPDADLFVHFTTGEAREDDDIDFQDSEEWSDDSREPGEEDNKWRDQQDRAEADAEIAAQCDERAYGGVG